MRKPVIHPPRYCLAMLFFTCLLPVNASALTPGEILVVANMDAPGSVSLADYYMIKRGVPKENLLKLRVTDKETCSRKDYDEKVARPVRRRIETGRAEENIRCIAIMYGLPLRVSPPAVGSREYAKYRRGKVEDQPANHAPGLKKKAPPAGKERWKSRKMTMTASLDSELSLVLERGHEIEGWIDNPYYLGNRGKNVSVAKENVLMVSRLDGPSERIVKRIIDDAVKVEREGLKGKAYFDARWAPPDKKKLGGYAYYDFSVHKAADRVRDSGLMPVILDQSEALFKPGACPDAALYCGWYRLGEYVDSFTWKPGSVGWHIASSECNTLKRKNSRIWCKMMLEKGVTATLGPVGEPYVQAFPPPAVFFGFLVDGYLSLAEVYIVSLPHLSWKMVLIGDPLYRPFDVARR